MDKSMYICSHCLTRRDRERMVHSWSVDDHEWHMQNLKVFGIEVVRSLNLGPLNLKCAGYSVCLQRTQALCR